MANSIINVISTDDVNIKTDRKSKLLKTDTERTVSKEKHLRKAEELPPKKNISISETNKNEVVIDLEYIKRINGSPGRILDLDNFGNTVMHLAAKEKNVKVFNELLNTPQGLKALLIKNNEGFYPTCLLLKGNDLESEPQIDLNFDSTGCSDFIVLKYPKESSNNPHKHEAKAAQSHLENEINKILIKVYLKLLEPMLKKMEQSEFVGFLYGNGMDNYLGFFPSGKEFDSSYSKQEYIEKIVEYADSNENHIMVILSQTWRLPKLLLEIKDSKKQEKLDQIFKQFDTIGRSHDIDEKWFYPVYYMMANMKEDIRFQPENTFGEAEIPGNLNKDLHQLKKLSKYYTYNSNPENILCQKNEEHNMPYLSGLSGMCNGFYSIYPLLDIDYDSLFGRWLRETMSSFVVGLGFHTYKECRDAFNITYEYAENPNRLVTDYQSGKGIFSPLYRMDDHNTVNL